MEIRLQGTALPCVAREDILAGLAVKIVPALSTSVLGGSAGPDPRMQNSLFYVVQGAVLPGADDAEARYVAAFRVYNEKPPLYEELPVLDIGDSTVPYTQREFRELNENLPADVTLRMVPPRLKEAETIPSGTLMLAYDDGIYTVPSGCYYGTSFAVGDILSVRSGGQWYNSSNARVATVFEFNLLKGQLTIKTGR
jgi:hypothetical protein